MHGSFYIGKEINEKRNREKNKQLQSCTLEEYDAMGGHIRNHVMAEQDALASLAQKKCISVFFEKEAPEAVIHEALTNRLVRKRLETWLTSPAYHKQRRIIMTYPSDSNIGYCYRMDGKNILYNECKYVCMVFLKTDKDDFILYTAYPENEKKLVLL